MKQYLDLLRNVYENGNRRGDRTGTGTRSIFGPQMRFDLSEGFPLTTTKKTFFRGIVHELIWLISGSTNIKYLTDNNVHIWDEWANEKGDLGPVYGKQWRDFGGGDQCDESGSCQYIDGVDQLRDVIERIKTNPEDRRLIVSAWNPQDTHLMSLPSCHMFFQFYVDKGKLSCHMYQRSGDMFLGVPFNIASYALLTMMVAQVCGLEPGEFIHSFGDCHIYRNHIDQVKTQLAREPYPLPTVKLNPNIKSLFDFKYEDVTLENYVYHPGIKAEVSV